MTDLTNRVALVTGGSRGIGRAIALALANAGAAVAVNYHEHERLAAEAVDSIRAGGRRAIAVGADVSSRQAVEAMVRRVEAELGSIDVLINNAGVATVRGLDDLTEDDFDRTIAINLKSAFLCISAVLPGMRAQPLGTDRQYLVCRGPRRRRDRRPLQRIEGRPRGVDARLRLAPGGRRRHGQRGRARVDRHRYGGAVETGRRGRSDSRRPLRPRRRGRAGGPDVGRQRLHDRPDHRGERRPAVHVDRRFREAFSNDGPYRDP